MKFSKRGQERLVPGLGQDRGDDEHDQQSDHPGGTRRHHLLKGAADALQREHPGVGVQRVAA